MPCSATTEARRSRQEWERLEYLEWKSGGDTNFAPLASATGELDCRGFWDHGKPDKDGIWTSNREIAPSLARYVESIGGNYGRVRVIKLNPSSEQEAARAACTSTTTTGSTRTAPAGWSAPGSSSTDTADQTVFILREDKDDPSTETRIPLHPGKQVVIDTERLWHVVWHPGPKPRYALITSWESSPVIDNWMHQHRPIPRSSSPSASGAARKYPPIASIEPYRARDHGTQDPGGNRARPARAKFPS